MRTTRRVEQASATVFASAVHFKYIYTNVYSQTGVQTKTHDFHDIPSHYSLTPVAGKIPDLVTYDPR